MEMQSGLAIKVISINYSLPLALIWKLLVEILLLEEILFGRDQREISATNSMWPKLFAIDQNPHKFIQNSS